jgi:hypothetical protein
MRYFRCETRLKQTINVVFDVLHFDPGDRIGFRHPATVAHRAQ